MPATFLCPHCSASYPVKPVLVGRAVRCTGCRNAFRLRADGIAEKVAGEAPAPEPAVAAPAVAEAPARNGHSGAAAQVPGSGSSGQRAAAAASARRLNQKQDELRRSMAATLASAANEALRAESVQREATAQPAARSGRLAAPAAEGGVGKIGPAVLTGHGRREFRNNLSWLLGCTGSLALVIGLGWLLFHRSPPERALHAYAAVVEKARNKPGERVRAIQERAWLAGQPPLVGLGRGLRLASARRCDLARARAVAGELGLADLVYLVKPPLWVAADKAAAVRAGWKDNLDHAANLAAVMREGTVVDHQVVSARLREAGIDEETEGVLLALLKGPLSPKAPADLGKRLLAEGGPDAIELCRFGGPNGELLIDDGRDFRHRLVVYEGWLVRFHGGGLPDEWRVLSITTSSRR